MKRKAKDTLDVYERILISVFIGIALLSVLYIVFFGHRYGFVFSCLITISYVALLLIIVGFQVVYLEIKERRWWHKVMNAAVTFALCAPIFSGVIALQSLYQNYQLGQFATMAFGKVIGFESEYRRSSPVNYATLQYEFENEIYNQKTENDEGFYHVGDSVKILFSKNDPELFEVVLSE